MDVACPKCHSEYELEDARVPDSGLTVKCAACGHVFRALKKGAPAHPSVPSVSRRDDKPASEFPSSSPAREWKVRHPSGAVSTCRELTTLQRWIVEGKASRDDQISLTGETWKRLGDIAELASFFRVVDLAAQANAHAEERAAPAPESARPPSARPPAPATMASPAAEGRRPMSPLQGEPPGASSPSRAGAPAAGAHSVEPSAVPSVGSLDAVFHRQTLRDPQFSTPLAPIAPLEVEPAPPQPRPRTRRFVAVLITAVGGLLVGAGLFAGRDWLRLATPSAAEAPRAADPVAPAVPVRSAEVPPPAQPPAEGAGPADAGGPAQTAAAAPVPAPASAPLPEADVDAGAGGPDARVEGRPADARELKRAYDGLLERADRLRERERPEQALELYERARELRPERAEPIAGRALSLLDLHRFAAAQAAFQQALRLNERYAPALMGLAETYRLQENTEKAIEYYRRYLEVSPEGPDAAVAKSSIERLQQ